MGHGAGDLHIVIDPLNDEGMWQWGLEVKPSRVLASQSRQVTEYRPLS